MPNLFARQTALTNVGGRIDYIGSPKRQEHLLAVYDGTAELLNGAYWQTLAHECSEAAKFTNAAGKQQIEGREIYLALSNALFSKMEPAETARILARRFEEKFHRPCIVAVHFNKAENNYHAHLIYSERELLKEPVVKTAERALFFDETGKRQYKKAAVLDENGELRAGCRIVKKGEEYERRFFGSVNEEFRTKSWLKKAKTEWLLPLRNGELKGDVAITEYDPVSGKLPQAHVGKFEKFKNSTAKAQILEYNRQVKEYNQVIDNLPELQEEEQNNLRNAVMAAQKAVKQAPKKNGIIKAYLSKLQKLIGNLTWLNQQKQQAEAIAADDATLEAKINAAARKAQISSDYREEGKHFYRSGWNDRSTRKPYKIGLWDQYGRKRSTIELIVILAITIIQNESKRKAENVRPEHSKPIYATCDLKVQRMIDTIKIAREENIDNLNELDRRLAAAAEGDEKQRLETVRNGLALARERQFCFDPEFREPPGVPKGHVEHAEPDDR